MGNHLTDIQQAIVDVLNAQSQHPVQFAFRNPPEKLRDLNDADFPRAWVFEPEERTERDEAGANSLEATTTFSLTIATRDDTDEGTLDVARLMMYRLERNPYLGAFPASGQFLDGLVNYIWITRCALSEDRREKEKAALLEITVRYYRRTYYD